LEIAAAAAWLPRYSTVNCRFWLWCKMRWLPALREIELALLIVGAGMMAAGLVAGLHELMFSHVSWQ
jgi:hypothetical protein